MVAATKAALTHRATHGLPPLGPKVGFPLLELMTAMVSTRAGHRGSRAGPCTEVFRLASGPVPGTMSIDGVVMIMLAVLARVRMGIERALARAPRLLAIFLEDCETDHAHMLG